MTPPSLTRAAAAIARLRLFVRRPFRREPRVIEPYAGLAGPDRLAVRGRVLSRLRRTSPHPSQPSLVNLAQMLSLFVTREVAHVPVSAEGVCTETDDEGYFAISVPRRGRTGGWHDVEVAIDVTPGGTWPCPVLIPRADARRIVISDIDDTVLQTGAHSLLRNLWTSLTGNAATRSVFPDAVALLAALAEDGRNPVCFVSASPWNFHGFLNDVFARAGLPRAPMYLRDLGLRGGQLWPGAQSRHKRRAIETVLAAAPHLPAVLVGDTGQHDAAIYGAVARRHPGRIDAIYLRRAARTGRGVEAEIAELRRTCDVPLIRIADRFEPGTAPPPRPAGASHGARARS